MAAATRPILDPTEAVSAEIWIPPGPIPKEIRKLGRYPNPENLRPGDLLLFSALQPGTSEGTIVKLQGKDYEAAHSQWHHAALCVGSGFAICEAVVKGGVRVSPLYPRLAKNKVLVRRVPDLADPQRWQIVESALWYLAAPYDFGTILNYALGGRKSDATERRASICSELYARALQGATGIGLIEKRTDIVVPALLSATKKLEDVAVGWVSLPQRAPHR